MSPTLFVRRNNGPPPNMGLRRGIYARDGHGPTRAPEWTDEPSDVITISICEGILSGLCHDPPLPSDPTPMPTSPFAQIVKSLPAPPPKCRACRSFAAR